MTSIASVNKSVQAGDYHTADELFASVLSIYKEQIEARLSEADQLKLDAFRRDVQHAADQLDRGEGMELDWDELIADRHRAYAARQPA